MEASRETLSPDVCMDFAKAVVTPGEAKEEIASAAVLEATEAAAATKVAAGATEVVATSIIGG